ncbi:hypothetical protein RclHR1_07700004 [Rhizophagus clarus]|uniref:Kinase-like domain-containing protein n=1 Tax=Rhizophagus clarus TaxID=94130 RepID=A0A2Z6RZU7_9GLOM|nr:hypothetical protein RclHR1_07700004 [Rhizophagus clarus]GES72662.1 kinase-like domain-containing protein [Rhizophagus clarus]
MSNDNVTINDMDYYNNLLNDYYVKGFDHFRVLKKIDTGSFAQIRIITLKDTTGPKFVLKCFNYDKTTPKEIINEIQLQREVDCHPNIIRLIGILKEPILEKYSLVLEYADGGTLQAYLQKPPKELKWDDKTKLTLQIASAISWLHDRDIIHCDLHAANILVHQDNIKLADFGQSRKIIEAASNSTSSACGVLPYVDPKCFFDKNYKLSKKSDVYSIGVIMWQISSGREPFHTEEYDLTLMWHISEGKREETINGTPDDYSNLYIRCWSGKPDERPDIQEVGLILQTISSKDDVFNNAQIQEDNIELLNNISAMNNSSESISASVDSLIINDNMLKMMRTRSSYQESINLLDPILVDKLIEIIMKKHDEGYVIDNKIQQIIYEQIFQLNQNEDNFVYWLKNNQNEAKYNWLLGLFYYYNILNDDTGDDVIKAFRLFSKASESNLPIAQVYLAYCYNEGYGTKKNEYKAFNWYIKSVESKEENKNFIGHFYLKYCIGIRNYEKSIHLNKESIKNGKTRDILRKKKIKACKVSLTRTLNQYCVFYIGQILKRIIYKENAFIYFEKAARSGNKVAQHNVGYCYRDGIGGAVKDERRAFEFFEKSAGQNHLPGIFRLGHCYDEGIGTKIDKAIAFLLYKKAARQGNIEAQNNLGRLYEVGEGTIKNLKKAIYWYEKAADNGNGLSQYNLGVCYENKIGVEKSDDKAFEYYKKSAEQKCTNGTFELAKCFYKGIGTNVNKEKAFKLYKKAAEEGHTYAQIKLGTLYEIEKEKKSKKAIYWYEKAAENGIALYNLGRCYEHGIGVNKNYRLAFKYYGRSAGQENVDGKLRLGNCFDKGIGTDINKKRAFELYNEVAEKGNPKVQNIVGSLYEKGEGTAKNLEKAVYWYKKADENGNKEASYNLSRLQYKAIEDDSRDFFEV